MISLEEFHKLCDDFNNSKIFNIKFIAAVKLFCASSKIAQYLDAPSNNRLISDIKQLFTLVCELDVVSLDPLHRVTNHFEFDLLWQLLENESAKLEVPQDLIKKKACLLNIENYDIEDSLNLFYASCLRQPKLDTDQQEQLQLTLLTLGGEADQHRVWFSTKIIASLLLPPEMSTPLNFHKQHNIHLVYFLLYLQLITNDGIEIGILFNLIQFSFLLEAANINGNTKNKFDYILELLWYRISILLWNLAIEQNMKLIDAQLGQEGTIDEKIFFFKILALFYYDKIKNKCKFPDQSHADVLDRFLRDSLSKSVVKIQQLSFISVLFEQDFFEDPKSVNDFSVRGLFLIYLECCRKKIQNGYIIHKLCGYLENQSKDLEFLCAATTTADERLAVYKRKMLDLHTKYSEQSQQFELLAAEHQQSSATVRQLLITSAELRASVEDTAKRLNDAEYRLQQQLADLKTKVDGLDKLPESAAISDLLGLEQLRNDFAIVYGAISYDHDSHSVFAYDYLNLLFTSYNLLLTRCLNDLSSCTESDTKNFKIKTDLAHIIYTILNYDSFRVEYNAILGVGDFTKVKSRLSKDFTVYSSRISAIVTHMEDVEQQLTVADHNHVIEIVRFVIQVGKLFSSKSELVCTPKV